MLPFIARNVWKSCFQSLPAWVSKCHDAHEAVRDDEFLVIKIHLQDTFFRWTSHPSRVVGIGFGVAGGNLFVV